VRILKPIAIALAGLALLLVVAIAALGDRDIPREVLVERYASAESRFLTLADGTVVHVRDQGSPSGETLVLVHGSNASLHTWEPWVARLGDAYRVISLDLPGHGLTGPTVEDDYSIDGMARFVDDVTRMLGADRFHLAGNSMGGRMAWIYALSYPERVDRLILIDASGFPDPPDQEVPLGFRLANTPVLRWLMLFVTPRDLFAVSLKDAFSDPAFVDDEMVGRYHELQLLEGSRAATAARFRLPGDDPRIAELGRIRSPTLILWGEEDRLTPASDALLFAEAIPDSRVRIYAGVGHIPMEEAPDRSAADVRAFLRGEI
jgi:pimeloyl-ACP methyl ester carboxylesterase